MRLKSKLKFHLSQVLWTRTLGLITVHIGALYAIYYGLLGAKWQTYIISIILGLISSIGMLTGAHRYGTHRAFKANLPLRVVLVVLQTMAGQKSMIEFALDHHTHHKYEGTHSDPTNINRGFLFAHIIWFVTKRHPKCEEKRQKINIDYLWDDPVIRFQYHYYEPLFVIFCVLIPTLIPYYLLNESLINSFHLCVVIRYVIILQIGFGANSLVHMFGGKPYDKSMSATDNQLFSYLSLGNAYHNYHHVFPQDYSESEFGWEVKCNINTAFIDFCHYIGWAYDLKKTPQEIIDKRRERTGSPPQLNRTQKNPICDWIFTIILSSSHTWLIFLFKYDFNTIYQDLINFY